MDFDSIFENFFGGGSSSGRTRRRQRGSDLRYDMEIELEDAALGATRTINVPRLEECEKCNGTGDESAKDIVTCDECGGRGVSTRTQRTPFGLFSTTTTCRKCRGQGKHIKNECRECGGNGTVRKNRKIEIKIPAGAETGTQLRVQGAGEAGEKGIESGDLYIVLHLKEHKTFEKHKNDVYIKMPLSFTTAALGGEIEVPTLSGKATLKIPAGTQSNTTFRMRGQGIPELQTHHTGDQHVQIYIVVPEKLSKKQKKLLEDFDKENKKKGFLDDVFG